MNWCHVHSYLFQNKWEKNTWYTVEPVTVQWHAAEIYFKAILSYELWHMSDAGRYSRHRMGSQTWEIECFMYANKDKKTWTYCTKVRKNFAQKYVNEITVFYHDTSETGSFVATNSTNTLLEDCIEQFLCQHLWDQTAIRPQAAPVDIRNSADAWQGIRHRR